MPFKLKYPESGPNKVTKFYKATVVAFGEKDSTTTTADISAELWTTGGGAAKIADGTPHAKNGRTTWSVKFPKLDRQYLNVLLELRVWINAADKKTAQVRVKRKGPPKYDKLLHTTGTTVVSSPMVQTKAVDFISPDEGEVSSSFIAYGTTDENIQPTATFTAPEYSVTFLFGPPETEVYWAFEFVDVTVTAPGTDDYTLTVTVGETSAQRYLCVV